MRQMMAVAIMLSCEISLRRIDNPFDAGSKQQLHLT